MPRFISYLRVSTSRQGKSGLGLEAQRQAVTQYLAGRGGNLNEELIEIESGSKQHRPILHAAMEKCRKEGATLVIAKLDRLSRNVAFISKLMETKVDFVACDAPHANKLMLHIMSAFAEYEREQISLRTKLALAAAKERGVELGKNGKRLARANRAGARLFAERHRKAFEELLANPAATLTSVAEQLNANGVSTREGSNWTATQVSRTRAYLRL